MLTFTLSAMVLDFKIVTMKKITHVKFNNIDLVLAMGTITSNMESLESTDEKMAVVISEDSNLDVPYAIDIEDTSFFYHNIEDRNEDFDKLCAVLTQLSTQFIYN